MPPQPASVVIEGTVPQVLTLIDVEGLSPTTDIEILEDGTARLYAFVTDEGWTALQQHPLMQLQEDPATVGLALLEPDYLAHLASLDGQIGGPEGYLTADQIDQKLEELAASYPDLATVFNLNHLTAGSGKPVKCIKIGKGSLPVLLVGGVHSNEWAPPDALLSLVEKLLESYQQETPIEDERFEVAEARHDIHDPPNKSEPRYKGRVVFEKATFPWSSIKRMMERLELYVIPCVNRDGREFSLGTSLEQKWWETNRRVIGDPETGEPRVCDVGPSPAIGVDLNRNAPRLWDAAKYYDAATFANEKTGPKKATTYDDPAKQGKSGPCDDEYKSGADPSHLLSDVYKGFRRRANYAGTGPGSEPETRNVTELIDEKKIKFFVDVHGFKPAIYRPWGINVPQVDDPYQSFVNDYWDNVDDPMINPMAQHDTAPQKGRPIGNPSTYGEYFPSTPGVRLLASHYLIQGHMQQWILSTAGADPHARNRSYYPNQAAFQLYPATGDLLDYAFATQLERDPQVDMVGGKGHKALIREDLFPVHCFALEVGHLSTGWFWPSRAADKNEFRKVQRETHFALLAMLQRAADWAAPAEEASPLGLGSLSF